MKKIILVLMILFIWLVFLQAGFPASLQEPVKGKIKVVNVEVPVRKDIVEVIK
ncbi:MAG: hypothetical protein KAW12_12330 [Candidatus Aminicenantes bacterium]|nr:hypothetical protein [Candidatus Aminicenantes bacterium]